MPSKTRNVLVALAVLITSISAVKAQTKNFNFESQLGVVDVGPQEELCLATPNSTLAVGKSITLVSPYKPQSTAKAVVVRKLAGSCSSNPDTSQSFSFYSLELMKRHAGFFGTYEPAPYIAIVGSVGSIKIKKGNVSIDLNRDGRREYFRKCTSSEGVHLTVWSGIPLKGKRRWHSYYYLGYDVVPTCTTNDYEE